MAEGKHVKTFVGMEKTTEGVKLIEFSEIPYGKEVSSKEDAIESYCIGLSNL